MRVHSIAYGGGLRKMAATLSARADARYAASPIPCATCNKPLTRKQRENSGSAKFCSAACAAATTNKQRTPRTAVSREKTSAALLLYHAVKPVTATSPEGLLSAAKRDGSPFSGLVSCRCAHCNISFVARSRLKYCNEHANLYRNNNRNRYAFTFSIKAHASAFSAEELSLLASRGMWSRNNTGGVTRDHRVSVNEAIKSGYDPYYIKHPMNCQLMPWADNNKKKTSSSLTYAELILRVHEYDAGQQTSR